MSQNDAGKQNPYSPYIPNGKVKRGQRVFIFKDLKVGTVCYTDKDEKDKKRYLIARDGYKGTIGLYREQFLSHDELDGFIQKMKPLSQDQLRTYEMLFRNKPDS